MKLGHATGVLFVVALGILVVRDAVLRSSLPDDPREAVLVWPAHPATVIADGMARIGQAASRHHPVEDSLTDPIIGAARRAPLAIEPFLVAGVKQQTIGNDARAGQLFLAAEQRDPRAVAPHLFLSAHYSKVGQVGRSLSELGKLIHLVPGSAGEIAPKIAASMQKTSGPAMMRELVAESPELRSDIMAALATDARNLDLVLSLRTGASSSDWQPVMIQSLVSAGKYDRALALWTDTNKVGILRPQRPLLFDPDFRRKLAPPFGWTLADASITSGVVEPAESRGLHVISYGRDAFTLASQTLLLSPGNYVFNQNTDSASGNISLLIWQVSCIGSQQKLGQMALVRGQASAQLSVPNNCPAQRLELLATLGDLPETLDATLGPVTLRRRK